MLQIYWYQNSLRSHTNDIYDMICNPLIILMRLRRTKASDTKGCGKDKVNKEKMYFKPVRDFRC